MPPIKFRIKNGKQTPSPRCILRRVAARLTEMFYTARSAKEDVEPYQLALLDVHVLYGKCPPEWRDKF